MGNRRIRSHGKISTAIFMAPLLAAFATSTAHANPAQPSAKVTKSVSYLGHTFAVPASWPVIDLAGNPHACVRFDRNAVYLGSPSADQSCPSHIIGHADALILQPAAATVATRLTDDPSTRQLTATAPGIQAQASYRDADAAQITQILASGGLPTTSTAETRTPQNAATAATVAASSTSFTGRAFDPCDAPSESQMSAWKANSPYGAIGIYIGGVNEGCSQPNLTSSWVSTEAAAGWHFFLLYVGPQAPGSSCSSCSIIKSPGSDADAAAQDAANHAASLGFGADTPIVYDMESYSSSGSSTALAFMSEWTVRLHALGYGSGVYSSEGSGVSDLINHMSSYTMPDVIDFANWNGADTTSDPGIPSTAWVNHQRIHQYSGGINQTYGGVTINVDQDAMDVVNPAIVSGGGSHQASEAASQSSGVVDLLYKGASGSLEHSWGRVGGAGWTGPVDLGGSMGSEPSTVTSSPGTVDSFWLGTDGNLWHAFTTGGSWSGPTNLGYGTLGSAPYAVAQANGDIDVFWRGANDDHLWYAQYTAGAGWSHQANDLGGDLAAGSDPAPAASIGGTTDVFYEGTDGALWHVFSSDYGASWTAPAKLGYGTISQPTATGHDNGDVDVFWRGTNDDHLWSAQYTAGTGWSTQATNLGGDITAGTVPAPTTSSDRTTDVFFKGTDGSLWHAYSNDYGVTWSGAVNLGMGAISQPYAAANRTGAVDVFWKGTADTHMWHTWFTPATGWNTTPANLGGDAA